MSGDELVRDDPIREWRALTKDVPAEAEPVLYLAAIEAKALAADGYDYDAAYDAAETLFREKQRAAFITAERDRRKRELRREGRRRRWHVARERLLDEGEDPTDRRVGEVLGLEQPDRTIRRWRADGDIP